MPALKARSPIVAMERSPLSEAQTARLLAAECHRLKSEYSSAGYEYDVLKKIEAAACLQFLKGGIPTADPTS